MDDQAIFDVTGIGERLQAEQGAEDIGAAEPAEFWLAVAASAEGDE